MEESELKRCSWAVAGEITHWLLQPNTQVPPGHFGGREQRSLGTQPGFTAQKDKEGPWQGWWGRQRVRRSGAAPTAELLFMWNPSEVCLSNVPNSTGWWEWKVLTNPGEKKDLYCKWVISLALTTTRELVPLQPPWKLQGMQNQPWKWFKEQFALSRAIVGSREREQGRSHVLVLLPADVKPRGDRAGKNQRSEINSSNDEWNQSNWVGLLLVWIRSWFPPSSDSQIDTPNLWRTCFLNIYILSPSRPQHLLSISFVPIPISCARGINDFFCLPHPWNIPGEYWERAHSHLAADRSPPALPLNDDIPFLTPFGIDFHGKPT